MKKYRASGYRWSAGKIEEIEVERESDQSVWIKGGREAKVTNYAQIFDDWESAHQLLLHETRQKLEHAKSKMKVYEKELVHIEQMKKPD